MTVAKYLIAACACFVLTSCAAQEMPSDDFASAVTRNCITDHADTAQRRACLARVDGSQADGSQAVPIP